MAISAIRAECKVLVGERGKYKRTAYDQEPGCSGRLCTPMMYGAPKTRTVFTPRQQQRVATEARSH